jgi:hypothetical protein|tara:strand:- start:809 stop:1087 length:279 start_codon:yes stop_codon:yes gene_type:complete
MGLKTIPFRDIEDKAENMYEAVAAMSGQAKIELQERILSKAIMDHQEEEDLDVFDEVEEPSPENYEEKEKVTTVAIERFIDGDVNWRRSTLE